MNNQGFWSILLLFFSNAFMTLAWYGHLKMKNVKWFENKGILFVILLSWGIAFFEYLLQVPANRMGFKGNGGPFNLFQLKVIQEVISLVVFTLFAVVVFKTDTLRWNHAAAFVLILAAVYLVFKK